MSGYRPEWDEKREPGKPSPFSGTALAITAFVLTALPLAVASALPLSEAAGLLDFRAGAWLTGTVSL